MNRLSEVLNPERQVMAGKDVRLSSHTGALSQQGSAPSFRVHPGALFADWRFWVALMILVLLIGYLTGSPMTDYYNGTEVAGE